MYSVPMLYIFKFPFYSERHFTCTVGKMSVHAVVLLKVSGTETDVLNFQITFLYIFFKRTRQVQFYTLYVGEIS